MADGPVSDVASGVSTPFACTLARRPSGVKPSAFLSMLMVSLSRMVARMPAAGWMACDGALAALALAIGHLLSPRAGHLTPPVTAMLVFALEVVVAGNISGLYDRQILQRPLRICLLLAGTTLIAILGLALFWNLVVYERIGRWILLITAVAFFPAGVLPRLAGHYAAHFHRIRVLLVGDSAATSAVARRLREGTGHYLLAGFCGDKTAWGGAAFAAGEIADIPRICREVCVDEIVITSHYLNRPDVLDSCFQAVHSGCRVLDEATFHEEIFEEVPVDQISERWFYAANLCLSGSFGVGLKRILDVVVAGTGLALTLPLMAVLWVLIRVTSRGPAIYSQIRCGQFGKPFRIYKFRSMRVDAEANGAQWAGKNDPRATPIGRFLRRTRFDEIPQFWNVLKGDMSFVGPRPERPELMAQIDQAVPYYSFRHLVRPGITGLAQVRFKYGSGIDDARQKLQYDLYYIKNWSVLLDVQIILRTITSLMKGSV